MTSAGAEVAMIPCLTRVFSNDTKERFAVTDDLGGLLGQHNTHHFAAAVPHREK